MGHLRGRAFYIGSRAVQREKILFSPVLKPSRRPFEAQGAGHTSCGQTEVGLALSCSVRIKLYGIAQPDDCQNYQRRLSPQSLAKGLSQMPVLQSRSPRLTVCMQSSILLKR